VRPYSGQRANFYNWLFNVTPATSTYYFTPLRRGLDNVGKYFETSDEPWRMDPADGNSSLLSCRSSFSILMTDGYWTGGTTYEATTSGAKANSDGTRGTLITGSNSQSYTYAPTGTFSDSYSNTLADVAMHYWKRDLRTNLTNNVPISEADPAFWQHMVTISISLGVDGTINKQDAFNALIYGLLRFASFFVSMSAGRVTQLRPYIRPLVRSLVISGPDGFPRVFIPIRTPVWMTSERSGFVKTPVRP
jgi:type IV pilus assembly protein PilY1